MSWQDRLRPEITFTSPDGDTYRAKWAGDEQTKQKNVGIFNYPNFNGTVVQDLGIQSNRFPSLSFWFDGEDNDTEGEAFYLSCDQRGVWTIVHPSKGEIYVQFTNISKTYRPIDDGNRTVFSIQCVQVGQGENTVPDAVVQTGTQPTTSAELANDINSQAIDTNIAIATQYDAKIKLDTSGLQIANTKMINSSVLAINANLTAIATQDPSILSKFTAISRGITSTISGGVTGVLNKIALASQVVGLIQTPIQAITDIGSRFAAIVNVVTSVLAILPTGKRDEDKNAANAAELTLAGCLVATAQIATSGEIDTRTTAIQTVTDLTQLLSDITTGLDAVQSNFDENDIDLQYFSQSDTYNDLILLIGNTINFLLESLLSLKIEKRFIIARPRSPIEITVKEYGSLGEDDSNLDFFISTNNLKGNEIRLLNPGFEVVVYV